jgi:DNA-directed RNA polymerase specialized sigma24 family protein
VALRLEQRSQVFNANADPYLPDDLPVAALAGAEEGSPAGLPLSRDEAERVRACFEAMPRRTRYVLTVRLGLGVPQQRLRDAAEPLALHLTRIHQLQLYALDALLHARERRAPYDETGTTHGHDRGAAGDGPRGAGSECLTTRIVLSSA